MYKSIIHEVPQGRVIGSFVNPNQELTLTLNIQIPVVVREFLQQLIQIVQQGQVKDADALKLASMLEETASTIRYLINTKW